MRRSFLAKSSGRRIDGNFVSGPASFGFHDSTTVPPVTVKMAMVERRSGLLHVGQRRQRFEEGQRQESTARTEPNDG